MWSTHFNSFAKLIYSNVSVLRVFNVTQIIYSIYLSAWILLFGMFWSSTLDFYYSKYSWQFVFQKYWINVKYILFPCIWFGLSLDYQTNWQKSTWLESGIYTFCCFWCFAYFGFRYFLVGTNFLFQKFTKKFCILTLLILRISCFLDSLFFLLLCYMFYIFSMFVNNDCDDCSKYRCSTPKIIYQRCFN